MYLVIIIIVSIVKFENEFTREFYQLILLLPVLLVGVFGVVSVAIIAYRVYTFNDCAEAASELQQQIKQAKNELSLKGIKFGKQQTS